MYLTFSPMRLDDTLAVSRQGDTLVVNGEPFDFAPLPEGASLPRDAVDCRWLASEVVRRDGVLHLTLILPHGADPGPEQRFPAPLTVSGDGPVVLPGQAGQQIQEVDHGH